MSTFRMAALASSLLLTCAASAAPVDDVPLSNWSAPPFWMQSSRAETDGGPARSARQALALPSSPLPFVAIAPCRQHDSRSPVNPLLQNTPQTITLTGAPCGIPATAQAAAVNITIFNITGAASNGVFSVGIASPPTTAWINYPSTETQRGNAGVVALTDAGEIIVQINQVAGFLDFVVDVSGYYAPAGIVNSLNTLKGDVTLAAGLNTTVVPSGNTLTIASAGATGPTGPTGATGPTGPAGPGPGMLAGLPTRLGIAPGTLLADFPFLPLSGPNIFGSLEPDNVVIIPATCSATLFAAVDVATGTTPGVTFSLRVNGVTSTTACTIEPTAGLSCSSTTPFAMTAGDRAVVVPSGPADYGNALHVMVALRCQ